MKARLFGSLLAGVVIAAALVVFEDKYRHAALLASVARSGGHQTVGSILTDGFVGVTLIVGLVVFVLATVRARRRSARAATERGRQPGSARRRSRAGAGW